MDEVTFLRIRSDRKLKRSQNFSGLQYMYTDITQKEQHFPKLSQQQPPPLDYVLATGNYASTNN